MVEIGEPWRVRTNLGIGVDTGRWEQVLVEMHPEAWAQILVEHPERWEQILVNVHPEGREQNLMEVDGH